MIGKSTTAGSHRPTARRVELPLAGPAARKLRDAGAAFWGNLHVVSEAFAKTGHEDEDAFTALTTRAVSDRACRAAGFDADGAHLIRLGENAMFRLREPVVVRVARTAAYEPDAHR